LLTRIAVAVAWMLHRLPLAVLAPIGSALGSLLYILGRERRTVCLINLSRCLPEMTQRERRALAKAHFRAFGRSVLERSILWWAPRERVMRLVKLSDSSGSKRSRESPSSCSRRTSSAWTQAARA